MYICDNVKTVIYDNGEWSIAFECQNPAGYGSDEFSLNSSELSTTNPSLSMFDEMSSYMRDIFSSNHICPGKMESRTPETFDITYILRSLFVGSENGYYPEEFDGFIEELNLAQYDYKREVQSIEFDREQNDSITVKMWVDGNRFMANSYECQSLSDLRYLVCARVDEYYGSYGKTLYALEVHDDTYGYESFEFNGNVCDSFNIDMRDNIAVCNSFVAILNSAEDYDSKEAWDNFCYIIEDGSNSSCGLA